MELLIAGADGVWVEIPDGHYGLQDAQGRIKAVPRGEPGTSKQGGLRWRAKQTTFLKLTAEPASSLQADEKVEAKKGQVVTATAARPESNHYRIIGATLDGAALGDRDYFIYPAMWEEDR
ncbi:hypothetical protein [Muricoccus aerilatus]|uniref:hypothetical protein n=1 Tax=Muricoccus aerilatus TaxID=452982 RepID=UPI000A75CF6E|nr:hypothetical protein [Roseomonas aerilata]